MRRFGTEVASLSGGTMMLRGEGRTMDHSSPTFVGRRQSRLDAVISAAVVERAGIGGLTIRYDEQHHYDLEIDGERLVARARLPTICQEVSVDVPPGPIVLYAECSDPGPDFGAAMTSDIIRLGYETRAGDRHEVTALDGRFLSAEVACSFTGRVAGVYCVTGAFAFDWYREDGRWRS